MVDIVQLWKSESEVAQSCPTLCNPMDVAYQAPSSMGFCRQKYWSSMPLPSLSVAVMSNSLWPHGLQHARLHCPSTAPRACSNSCPSSPWCQPTMFCSPLLLLPSIFPSIRVFLMSQLFASGGQTIGASTSTSVLPKYIQDWFPLELTSWISLLSKELPRVFPTPQFKSINSSVLRFLYGPTLTSIHDYWKNHSFD